MEKWQTGAECIKTQDGSCKRPRTQAMSCVVHLVIPWNNPKSVVGEVLSNGLFRLPTAKLPPHLECKKPNQEHDIAVFIETRFGIRGHIARYLFNGENTQIDKVDGIERHRLLLIDALDDKPVLQEPLEWIDGYVACSGKWMSSNGNEEGSTINSNIEGVFKELDDIKSAFYLQPWGVMGWIGKTTSWTRKVLERRNMVMEGRLRQRSLSGNASVLSCDVETRSVGKLRNKKCEAIFIKAYFPSIREAQRTAAIREVIGNIVPEVIGFQESEGLMLQRCGGALTDSALDQEALINTVFKMQELTMNRLDELEAGGLMVADSEWVESNVEWILNHKSLDAYYYSGPDGEVNEEEKMVVDMLRSNVGTILQVCRKFRTLGLPRTIVHGDLHPENVGGPLRRDGETTYQMFDWARSFIGNPLHDFVYLLGAHIQGFPEHTISYKTGARQVYEHLKPCAKIEDMKSVLVEVEMMNDVIRMYDTIRLQDACVVGTEMSAVLFDDICMFIESLHARMQTK